MSSNRWIRTIFAGRAVLVTWAIISVLLLYEPVFVLSESLWDGLALFAEPGFLLGIVGHYLLAVVLGAIARWAGVYRIDAWRTVFRPESN